MVLVALTANFRVIRLPFLEIPWLVCPIAVCRTLAPVVAMRVGCG